MLTDVQPPERKSSKEELALLRLYVDRFNRRDWQGVRELASADARLRVADCFAGRLADSPYFVEYERPIIAWRMALGEADGETVVVILRDDPQGAVPFSAIRIGLADGRVAQHYRLHQVLVDLGDGFHLPHATLGDPAASLREECQAKKFDASVSRRAPRS